MRESFGGRVVGLGCGCAEREVVRVSRMNYLSGFLGETSGVDGSESLALVRPYRVASELKVMIISESDSGRGQMRNRAISPSKDS